MKSQTKIVMGIVIGGFYCCAPLFIHAEVSTNAPISTTPAPTSGAVSNQPPQVSPTNDSIDSLRLKAKAGDTKSQSKLGDIYLAGKVVPKDSDQAVMWYRMAAEQGDAYAQDILGNCYFGNGSGVERDPIEAAKWLHKAADQGNADAQNLLGASYQYGIGVEKNSTEAAKWYRKAADQGDAKMQYNLGFHFYTGVGFEKNDVEAVKWFRKAADQGHAGAEWYLAQCYETGSGVKQDKTEAIEWYHKAADQGGATAQIKVGECYQYGIGVEKNIVEAMMWYRKAADQGNAGAQFDLGNCYCTDTGVLKDVVEAAKWFRKAADQGYALAQSNLGLLYIKGEGVIKNEVEGLAWLYVSSANGNEATAKLISLGEATYSGTIVSAARQRATEIQAQIASHSASNPDNSAAATLQPIPPPNTPKASGSGAFISADGLVLTAAHVVQGASRIEVVTAAGNFAATVVKMDTTNDVALLKCTGSNFTPLPIAPSKEARAGASVFTVGFPNIQIQGFDPKLTNGEISSQTGFQDDPREWQISVPIQPGNSGGPLCDENGNLIGIVEATLNPFTMAKIAREIPQNVNYAVKSSYILPLLDDVPNLPPPRSSPTGKKFEDVVESVRPSTVLILVY